MHAKLVFWMSVMLLVGDIIAENITCVHCDADIQPGDCDPTQIPPETLTCDNSYDDDKHCITLALGNEIKEKNCASKETIKKLGGKGNDCIQVNGLVYKTHYGRSSGLVRRTLKEGGPTGRFDADPFTDYEFCTCRGDKCNSPLVSPFGANDPNYDSLALTTTTTTTTAKAGAGEGAKHSSLGFGSVVAGIMCVALVHSIYGF